MGAITNRTTAGITKEKADIIREVSSAISILQKNADIMAVISGYLVENETNPDIGTDFIEEVVADFHAVMSGLPAPLATLNTVGKLFTADDAEKATARSTIATMNAGKESLELRYK